MTYEPLRAVLEVAGDRPTPDELEAGISRARAELADAEERLRELLEERRIHQRVGAHEDARRTKEKITEARREIGRWRAARSKLQEMREDRMEVGES